MSHRRAYDPKAPAVCLDGGAQSAQEPQEGAEAQPPAEELGGQEAPQEAPEPGESEDAPPAAPEPEPVAEADVPENADDVVAWVGADVGRARAALAKEARRPKERKTVKALAKLLDG